MEYAGPKLHVWEMTLVLNMAVVLLSGAILFAVRYCSITVDTFIGRRRTCEDEDEDEDKVDASASW